MTSKKKKRVKQHPKTYNQLETKKLLELRSISLCAFKVKKKTLNLNSLHHIELFDKKNQSF